MQNLIHNPHQLLMVDRFGAFTSALFHGAVLLPLNHWVGLSVPILGTLTGIAVFFGVFTYLWQIFMPELPKKGLLIIALLNSAYCLLTTGILYRYWSDLSTFGATFFILELAVVMQLIVLELKAAKN